MRIQAEAEQEVLQGLVGGEVRHGAAVHDAAVVSITRTSSPTSTATRKFCSTSRIVTPVALISSRHSISEPTIAGARPLVGSSIKSSLRGSTMARAIDSICFCPPDSAPARDSQNFLKAGKKPKIHVRRFSSSGPSRAPSTRFSLTERSENTAIVSGA